MEDLKTPEGHFKNNWPLEGKQASMQIHQSGTLRRTCSMACKLLLFFSPLTCFFNKVSNTWKSDSFISYFYKFVCFIMVGASFYPDPSIRFRILHETELFDAVLETNWTRLVQTQSKCWFKLDPNQSNFLIQTNQTCSNSFKLDQIGSKLFKLDQNGSNWFKLDPNWSNLFQSGTNLFHLIKLDQIGSKWSILRCHLSTILSDLGLNAF